jgi:hypothetical protein
MALGSTQPLTEISTRNLPGGKRPPEREADNPTIICEPTVGLQAYHVDSLAACTRAIPVGTVPSFRGGKDAPHGAHIGSWRHCAGNRAIKTCAQGHTLCTSLKVAGSRTDEVILITGLCILLRVYQLNS